MTPLLKYLLILVLLSCTTLWNYVSCKKEKNNEGLRFVVKLPENETQEFGVGIEKANWYEAETVCRKKNMRLTTIKSTSAAEKIVNIIEVAKGKKCPAFGCCTCGHFWTSGNDLAELGIFYWMSTGEEITRYTNWKSGKPPTKEERSVKHWEISPNCIFLTQDKSKYLWDYGPCDQKKYFVCEQYKKKWRED